MKPCTRKSTAVVHVPQKRKTLARAVMKGAVLRLLHVVMMAFRMVMRRGLTVARAAPLAVLERAALRRLTVSQITVLSSVAWRRHAAMMDSEMAKSQGLTVAEIVRSALSVCLVEMALTAHLGAARRDAV